MPVNTNPNEIMLRCACYSLDHHAFLTYDPDTSRDNNLKAVDDDWYLSVFLDKFTFWKRVRMAFRYVFAPDTIRYGHYAEIVLKNEDIDKLAAFIRGHRENNVLAFTKDNVS